MELITLFILISSIFPFNYSHIGIQFDSRGKWDVRKRKVTKVICPPTVEAKYSSIKIRFGLRVSNMNTEMNGTYHGYPWVLLGNVCQTSGYFRTRIRFIGTSKTFVAECDEMIGIYHGNVGRNYIFEQLTYDVLSSTSVPYMNGTFILCWENESCRFDKSAEHSSITSTHREQSQIKEILESTQISRQIYQTTNHDSDMTTTKFYHKQIEKEEENKQEEKNKFYNDDDDDYEDNDDDEDFDDENNDYFDDEEPTCHYKVNTDISLKTSEFYLRLFDAVTHYIIATVMLLKCIHKLCESE
ncbi:hypothetical protein SNEBB_008575 [Seison nebaliae]|nr:hypothetical protein SNEBB_008575 [Seison nebaliae]